jgi:hypothetical protein
MANPNPTPAPENLRPRPWPPGTSGNPEGYSRARRISDGLKRLLDDPAVRDKFLRVALDEAMAGRFPFYSLVCELVEPAEKGVDNQGLAAAKARAEAALGSGSGQPADTSQS